VLRSAMVHLGLGANRGNMLSHLILTAAVFCWGGVGG
jgi:ABC-type dipeptide/oligopeptide/nickel transport system permease component